MTTDAQRTGRLVLQDTRLGINVVNPKNRRSHLILTLGVSGINAVNPQSAKRCETFCLPDDKGGYPLRVAPFEGLTFEAL